ncbi:MAG TPA: NUDIX hydrolase [Acidimicrobiales bacterium]|nr:NUDIX hydrolase [Acidimicrobiales bacterium]
MPEIATADRWFVCHLGHVHWGARGGAGLLLRYRGPSGELRYLLAQRSRWVDEGGTWGVPGGAIHDAESPEEAAHREATEEISPVPAYRVVGTAQDACGGGWTFYLVIADVDAPFDTLVRHETDATGWFSLQEMATLPLHPRFRAWAEEHLGLPAR